MISYEKNELKEIVAKYGDSDWIKNIYFRPSPIFIIEFIFFIFSLIILYFIK